MGFLRALFQECSTPKEISWIIPACSLVVLTASFLTMVALSIILKYHPSLYNSILEDGGQEVNSWLDESTIPKLFKFLNKWEFENKLGSKKNQTLWEAVDKNERKKFMRSMFYLITVWLPNNFLILLFIRVKKSIRRMMVKRFILIKSLKQISMNFSRVCEAMMASARNLLWNILSI